MYEACCAKNKSFRLKLVSQNNLECKHPVFYIKHYFYYMQYERMVAIGHHHIGRHSAGLCCLKERT